LFSGKTAGFESSIRIITGAPTIAVFQTEAAAAKATVGTALNHHHHHHHHHPSRLDP
jgi:hypothetical protein